MTTLATLEYAPIELSRPSISEELSKLKLRRPSKPNVALLEALLSPDVSAEELHPLLLDPATAQLPVKIQGFAWDVYGDTLFQAGRYAEALMAFQRAIQLRPDYPEAHYDRGVVLVQLGRHQEALETFERAIQLRPHFPEAHNNQGVVLGQLGRHQEALEAFERAIQLRPDDPAAHNNQGVVLGQLGRHQEALEAFERAIELRPDDPEAHYNRGLALVLLGRHQEALEAFERAIELRPDDPKAHGNRGATLGLLGRQQETLEAFEHVYPLRRALHDLDPLYSDVASVSLLFGLSALKRRWLPDLEAATKAFIKWRDRARRDKQLLAFKQAVEEVRRGLTEEEDMTAFEEFMLGVRLMSIRDPFKAWDALAKEISKDWPKGVSAVQAIREQRRW